MREDHTREIIGCIIEVHRELGPGFLEIIYRRALAIELRLQGMATETERPVLVYYKKRRIGRHVIDLVVEKEVIIELKTVESLSKAHYAQVRSYLAATGLPTALLVNFAGQRADYRRVDAPDPSSSGGSVRSCPDPDQPHPTSSPRFIASNPAPSTPLGRR